MVSKNAVHYAKQRGDTIVEVLISIAVVSMILGGAYVTTNRSLYATRAAQEQSVALKLAQSQLEQVKGLAASNPNALFGSAAPTTFCIAASSSLPVTSTSSACAVGTAGTPTSAEPIFHISIQRTNNTFALSEWWWDVSGSMRDGLKLTYRVYQN